MMRSITVTFFVILILKGSFAKDLPPPNQVGIELLSINQTLNGLMGTIGGLTGTLGGVGSALTGTVGGLASGSLGGALGGLLGGLGQAVGGLGQTVGGLGSTLGGVVGDLGKTVNGLGTLLLPESPLDTGGSGCRDGTVASAFNPDRTLLTLIYSNFTAEIGPNAPQDRRRKFCAITLRMKVPANWTLEVEALDWRGYVDVDTGVRAVLRSVYLWRGEKDDNRVNVKKVVKGEYHDNFGSHKDGEIERKNGWLPCTRRTSELQINTVARLCYEGECDGNGPKNVGGSGSPKGGSNNRGSGQITVDSLDAKFKQELNIGWKRC